MSAEIQARAAQLQARFQAAGAQPVETAILQPAAALLDLYGEDIRARAYITSDALRGEQMLRPDFTVPVVQKHMAHSSPKAAAARRYTYAGKVFRRQEHDPQRANEYMQVGFEIFDADDLALADADVFAAIADALAHLRLRAITGDMGLLKAMVQGLHTTEQRKRALLRHIWRPRRFRALLENYAGQNAPSPERAAVLRAIPQAQARPTIGLRSAAEIASRIQALREEAATPPLPAAQMDMIATVLALSAPLPRALTALQTLTHAMPAIAEAVAHMHRRTEALSHRGMDVETIGFEGRYGRTRMEYYDGFVFGFHGGAALDWPPVATGGRYDALTRALGRHGRAIPAVGGVIRPDLVVALESQTP